MLRRIKFNNEVIEVKYDTNEEALDVYGRLYDFEKRVSYVVDNSLVYKLERDVYIFNKISQFLIYSNDEAYSYKRQCVDIGELVEWLDITAINDNLFRLSLIDNEYNTVGKFGFGCWQFGKMLSFNDKNKITVILKNSNMDDFKHEIILDKKYTVVIDIAEAKFEGLFD